ncbi:DUF488 family protein [Lysobacter sp. F6437]|uniref:DUF488 family protein n=1 Tax=Lysobacter sp. F6437 TaxID=3459296 RepID=UPI00403DBC1D
MATDDTAKGTLWTIGHSTRPWEVFLDMLGDARIGALVDVRRFAGSRRNPQFSGETMARELPTAGIEYVAAPDLGGRRKADPDTHNTAWRNASFRGYADYMETQPWQAARDRLAKRAADKRVAIMCAEALWWQCHRGLISDDFKVHGWEVIHLMAPGKQDTHPYTSAARIVGGKLDYSAPEPPQPSLF